jgi:putative SOS response-associated peptidase YedK
VAAKEPWFIRRADGAPLVMAGIWQVWQGEGDQRLTTCAIVTAQATGGMAALHDRVPVVLEPGDWALWLGEAGPGAAQLMRAPAEGVLTWHRVGPAVNSSRAEGPELIAPVAG